MGAFALSLPAGIAAIPLASEKCDNPKLPVELKENRLQNDLDGAYFLAFLRQGNNHWLEKLRNLPSPISFFASIL
jgi:hypothetical protein